MYIEGDKRIKKKKKAEMSKRHIIPKCDIILKAEDH